MSTPLHLGDLPSDQRTELTRLLDCYQHAKAEESAAAALAAAYKARIDAAMTHHDLIITPDLELARVLPTAVTSFDPKGLHRLIQTLRQTANDDTADAILRYERVTIRAGYLRIGPGKPAYKDTDRPVDSAD